jgi:hypothetical protein
MQYNFSDIIFALLISKNKKYIQNDRLPEKTISAI